MMTSAEIRQKFLAFFESKGHKIVSSAPIVIKDDPTLMFTNAGMNQFKDFFLGNKTPDNPRIVDTQKCLRVSGKHNDLEEVGVDTYHHTMFEMLGNWSIGDYFKAEAIQWSWELLTEVYHLPKDRLYASVFEGDTKENLKPSTVALEEWKKYLPVDQIIYGNKKDNFWEMGDTGPCGPCSEIHIDLRTDEERALVPGRDLVNNDHPQVIEIWNNVFIQFNRKADGTLEELPAKHVDTGMGFERLVRAIQHKSSNYDTDVFTGTIDKVAQITNKTYHFSDTKEDIAFRVLADHIRAICFTIADGQLPSNTGAGYVIRRILRRAVRYYYSYLDYKQPLLHQLVDTLADQFEHVFPELDHQRHFVEKVIKEEERSFLKTLEGGLRRLDMIKVVDGVMDGNDVFELYDTFGFPIDLTRLIASEKSWSVDEAGFNTALQAQKERGRADAKRETGDWVIINEGNNSSFVGYDDPRIEDARVLKVRTLKQKDVEIYQLVIDKSPFYPEGGGQVGDTGLITVNGEMIKVLDTKKEDGLIIQFVDRIPDDLSGDVMAEIDTDKRALIEKNHSATHLLHSALRKVLGTHVQQKGSLVREDHLRFDISHFQKITDEEIMHIERIVNERIRQGISLEENRSMAIADAKNAGAMMLFGEKYGDSVRMITFDATYSRELCGGCHVKNTSNIGTFKITAESGIAAGVRRIEAVTSQGAESYFNAQIHELNSIKSLFKNNINTYKNIADIQSENKNLQKEIERLRVIQAAGMKDQLIAKAVDHKGYKLVAAKISDIDTKSAKTLAANISQSLGESVIFFGIEDQEKPSIMIHISESLTKSQNLHAGNLVKELAQHIGGNGGGQAFFATAGGSDVSGLDKAIAAIQSLL